MNELIKQGKTKVKITELNNLNFTFGISLNISLLKPGTVANHQNLCDLVGSSLQSFHSIIHLHPKQAEPNS